jgi:2-C-methyl-D-erythritol 4-phosphate cytidylyltransferase
MAIIRGLVVAAGQGARFGATLPKQYQLLAGRPMLVHSVEALLAHPAVSGVTLVVAPDDSKAPGLGFSRPAAVDLASGGASRALSVLNGLRHIAAHHDSDWVLVHDAARPCLSRASLERLLDIGLECADGALLALPVSDTLKAADDENQVQRTVNREGLWQAQTPQLFPLGRLTAALEAMLAAGQTPTDEASVMEHAGARPRLVRGSPSNLKVTWQEDLVLARALLSGQAVNRGVAE